MCLCVRKDVWVIFEQHLLRWSSNAWGELKVKSEEKMLDFLVAGLTVPETREAVSQ
jgi:hypothetical protein